jgi:hypothetical protein
MTKELFQTIYIYASTIIVLILTYIFQKKEDCPCHIKAPSAFLAFVAIITFGFINNFNPLTYILSFFILVNIIGSILFSKVGPISGGLLYSLGFISLLVGFQMFGIRNLLSIGLERSSLFGALLFVLFSHLKKREDTIMIYMIGLCILCITSILSGYLPLMIGGILISLSEIMLIYNNEYKDPSKQIIYFSASLYSYGILLIPLCIL